MFFGSDWLANLYMGCFLFGVIFTSLSLVLGLGHFGGDASGAHADVGALHADAGVHADPGALHADAGAHSLDGGQHAGAGHDPGVAHHGAGLSPLNLPTILAGVTWFGGAGYILRSVLGWSFLVTGMLALASGVIGGLIVFLVLSYILQRGQTPPMESVDFYLPGTRARVISSIAPHGTGEIVFMKGGERRVEGARSESGAGITRGVEVMINRYERGLAYVVALGADAGVPPPVFARVDAAPDEPTRPLDEAAPAVTRDLRDPS